MTTEVTEAGYYRIKHDSIVHFRFEDVFDLELNGLNHQNVLSTLGLELFDDSETQSIALHVELEHCFGLSGAFRARQARVLGITTFAGELGG